MTNYFFSVVEQWQTVLKKNFEIAKNVRLTTAKQKNTDWRSKNSKESVFSVLFVNA